MVHSYRGVFPIRSRTFLAIIFLTVSILSIRFYNTAIKLVYTPLFV